MVSSLSKPLSVAIIYGFAEGPAHGRALRAALISDGFSIEKAPSHADIIITHSGGTMFLPNPLTARMVLIVAPSCGRDRRSVRRVAWAKFENNLPYFLENGQGTAWLRKFILNVSYLVIDLKHSLLMASSTVRGLDRLPSVRADSIVVVSYERDPWSGYMPQEEMAKHPSYRFIKRTGVHDDLWINPEYYVKLLSDIPSTKTGNADLVRAFSK